MTGSHQCPADGCTRRVPAHQLMCRTDWYRVPKPLRNAVYAAWRSGAGAGTPAHTAAILAAVKAVNEGAPS
jgi:hypothetical protein